MLLLKLLFSGLMLGLIFAPVFFWPAIFSLSYFCYILYGHCESGRKAFLAGYVFSLGFFVSSLYWISFALLVFEKFMFLIPFALLGLPMLLSFITAIAFYIIWRFRASDMYHFLFAIIWVLSEWVLSWLFTGLPWSLLGYGFAFSDILLQSASIFGVLGLSFIAVFIGSIFFNKNGLICRSVIAILAVSLMVCYGVYRLNTNPTIYNNIKVRVVQPSIAQNSKWSPDLFWAQLDRQVQLSALGSFKPDLIVWSEAALVAPVHNQAVMDALMGAFSNEKQILITGAVSDNHQAKSQPHEYQIYSSMVAVNGRKDILVDYRKSHLVPFGEYVPLKKYLPLQKITDGFLDYSPGVRANYYSIPELGIKFYPLICYESIFFDEIKTSAQDIDVIINITNDAWYGHSSGPYQHLHINRVRAIEHGLPMIRAANNGISAIIDPLGRIENRKLELDDIGVIDSNMPKKLQSETLYSRFNKLPFLFLVVLVLFLQKSYVFYRGRGWLSKFSLE